MGADFADNGAMATRAVFFLMAICLALSFSQVCTADFRVVEEEPGRLTTWGRAFSASHSMVYVDQAGRLHYQSLVNPALKWSKPGFRGPVSISSDGNRILAVRRGKANSIDWTSMSLWMFDSLGNALAKYPRDGDQTFLYAPQTEEACILSPNMSAALVKRRDDWLLLDGSLNPLRAIKARELCFSTTGKYVIGTVLTGDETTADMVAYRASNGKLLLSRSSSPYSMVAAGPNDELYVQFPNIRPAHPSRMIFDLFSGNLVRLISLLGVVNDRTKWEFSFDDEDHGVFQRLNGGRFDRFRYSFSDNRFYAEKSLIADRVGQKFELNRTYFDSHGNYLMIESVTDEYPDRDSLLTVSSIENPLANFQLHSDSPGFEMSLAFRDSIITELQPYRYGVRIREPSIGKVIGKYEGWERVFGVSRGWLTTTPSTSSFSSVLRATQLDTGYSNFLNVDPGVFLFGPVTDSGYTLGIIRNQLSIANLANGAFASIDSDIHYPPNIQAGYAKIDKLVVSTYRSFYVVDTKRARVIAKRSLENELFGSLIGASPSGQWTAWRRTFDPEGQPYFSDNKPICIKDSRTGEVRCILKGHLGRCASLQFAGEDLLVSLGSDGDLKKWDLNTGAEIASVNDAFYGRLVYVNEDATRLNFYMPAGGFVKAAWD